MTKKIDGEIDAAWKSYYGKKQKEIHGETMNAKNGETIDATPKEESGSETMSMLPSEVDESNLTDLQREIIQTAVVNRSESTEGIAEIVDTAGPVVRRTLLNNCPEWYETVFKQQGTYSGSSQETKVKNHLEKNGPASVSETAEDLGISNDTARRHLEAHADEVKTGVDGYHGGAKVYFAEGEDSIVDDGIEELKRAADELAQETNEPREKFESDMNIPEVEELEQSINEGADGQTADSTSLREAIESDCVGIDPRYADAKATLREIETIMEGIKATHHEDCCERLARHVLRVIDDE